MSAIPVSPLTPNDTTTNFLVNHAVTNDVLPQPLAPALRLCHKTVYDNMQQLLTTQPDSPLYILDVTALQKRVQVFVQHFPDLVTYAMKANPHPLILTKLIRAGVHTFDVASIGEIAQLYACAHSVGVPISMHYNNPIKAEASIKQAHQDYGVTSFSIDDEQELAKCQRQLTNPSQVELSVRFTIPQKHAVMIDLNTKFGANPDEAIHLLRQVAAAGFKPSLTFHPGTQCTDPQAYEDYIRWAAHIAQQAQVEIYRLNVGGGFPAHYVHSQGPKLTSFFDTIKQATQSYFSQPPQLVCEPGRAMINDSVSLLVQVIHRRDNNTLFLNDGIYGSFSELQCANLGWSLICWRGNKRLGSNIGSTGDSRKRHASSTQCLTSFQAYGPTCDSIDVLPVPLTLPSDIQAGDYIEITNMGAYSSACATTFNSFVVSDYVQIQH